MHFSPPKLHASLLKTPAHKSTVEKAFALRAAPTIKPALAAPTGPVNIAMTTVSLGGNFEAYLDVMIRGADQPTTLLFDSGNSMLIMPRWEDFAALPPALLAQYKVLGKAQEPWGCPANVVQGPIDIPTADGTLFTLPGCVFYACTADNPDGERTANFGAGCIVPWSASGWDTPLGATGVCLQAPLSYATGWPCAVIDYAPVTNVLSAASAATPQVATGSNLWLYPSMPGGFSLFPIIPDKEWMSLTPKSLAIGDTLTQWPGSAAAPIAMVDTGGGPAFLSDPNGYLYDKTWPDPALNPWWTSSSTACESTADAITVTLEAGDSSYTYTIDPSFFPPSVQGLTLVMCEMNAYMMGEQGMNIGGVSALRNLILVDYSGAQVGFKPKPY